MMAAKPKPTTACKPPTASVGQYVTQSGDPDDTNADIFPGCTTTNYYVDDDGDGYGTGDPIASCVEPVGKYATQNGDCDDNDTSINPNVFITYYPDNDGDGYGDPNGETVSQPVCNDIPDGYAANGDDCDDSNPNRNPGIGEVFVYLDQDGDGYGYYEAYLLQDSCIDLTENQSYDNTDCNDTDDTIHPNAVEIPNDGIDNDCDGKETIIWDGPSLQFNKSANDANWADNEGPQDQITKKIALTRSNNGYITNIRWWLDETGQAPTENEDLPWEYLGRKAQDSPTANVGDAIPIGGPQGVRWAILEQGGNTQAWQNFDMYGILGASINFYSLNNITTICELLNNNEEPLTIIDDFGIDNTYEIPNDASDYSSAAFKHLENVVLGVWLMEENIYFTLTFSELTNIGIGGGPMIYTRSTPNN